MVSSDPNAVSDAPAGSTFGKESTEFELVVEDVFFIRDRGLVITGQVSRGSVTTGQSLRLLRNGMLQRYVQVVSIEMFRCTAQSAGTDDNVGLFLTEVIKEEIQRGDLLTD